MSSRVIRAALIVTLALATTFCASPTGPDNAVTIEGIVSDQPGGSPISGAVVSTSLDSTTVTTDASGHFELVTRTGPAKDYSCTPYTVTVTAAGHPTYSVTGPWGAHPINQRITLSPPNPGWVSCH